MERSSLARDLAIVLSAAFIGGLVAKKLKLPLLVGYLAGGILVSTILIRITEVGQEIQAVAEIGAAFLLFTLGLDFSLHKLRELGDVIVLASFTQVILTVLAGVIVFPLLGFDFFASLFMGTAFSLSSTAVAVKVLTDRGELETLHGEIASGWLFMQDLYALPLMIILPKIGKALGTGNSSLGAGSIISLLGSVVVSIIVFFLVMVLGRSIIPKFLERVANLKSRELILIAAVVLILLSTVVFGGLGLTSALGAFTAGVLLSSTLLSHGILSEIRPLQDIFSIVFFVSLGFLIRPEFIIAHAGTVVTITIFVMTLKLLISLALMVVLGYHTKTATLVSLSLMSVGEFAFLVALTGLSLSLITPDTYAMILSVSFFSLLISSPILAGSHRIYHDGKHLVLNTFPKIGTKIFRALDHSSESIKNDEIRDHVVVLGYGRVGKYICRALTMTGISFVVVDYNHRLVKRLHKEGTPVIYGDPSEIDVLKFAKVDRAKIVILAYADRHTQEIVVTNAFTLNPQVKFICRVHFEEDQDKLKSLGVETLVQPEFEAALSITKRLLTAFSIPNDKIDGKLKRLKIEHGLG